jgi:tetratricopeptide (TPR) repeat protein
MRLKASSKFSLILSSLVGAMLMLTALVSNSFAQSIITVSSSDDGEVNRLVFFISGETNYQADRQDDQFIISFSENLDFDFATLANNPLPHISNPSYVFGDEGSVVSINLAEGTEVNHFRQGSRLVVEVNLPVVVEPEIEAEEPTLEETLEATLNADNNIASEADDNVAAIPVANVGSSATSATSATSEADLAENQLNNLTESVAEDDATNAEVEATQAVEVPEEQTPVPVRQIRQQEIEIGEILNISMENDLDEQVLVFTWRFPVGAAVFTRAGYLWVIFDEESTADLVAVQPFLNDRLLSAEQARGSDQTLFRFRLKGGQGIVTERHENSWVVRISDTQIPPIIPISLARQENIGDNFRIFIPLENPGPHMRILDPAVGDILDVIPVFDGGMGSSRERVFAQFKILPSAQGLILTRTSDQVVVSRFSNGVAIGGVTNLAVSLSPLATDLGLRSEKEDESLRPARLIDFEVWRLGDLNKFNENRINLFLELANANEEEINDRRWDAARFYLGHDMPTEALAFLDLMAEQSAEITVDPKYRAVRGVALYFLRRYDEAWRQLSARELDAEASVFLWRSLIAQKQEKHQEALVLFERGRESLSAYESEKANLFRIAVVESSLSIGKFDTANWQLSLLRRSPMSPYQKAEVDYLEGYLLELRGEYEEAMNYFEQVDEFINRRAAAYARYSMTISRFERDEITSDEAIIEMERLRYSWRGDIFEQRLLHGLGNLYIEKKDYRMGLLTLRQAISTFKESNETRAMATEMVAAYRNLFLDGVADEMPAVQALALYYDFRELTPLGAEGDQMIRKLADRLVTVDLLARAAELLDHQVRFRLSGAAQSIIAIRLAKIYLLDHRPNKSLGILRATRQNTFPADVLEERNLVEARTLTELGRFEEAEVLTRNISGMEAQVLLADIYWGSENWAMVDEAIGGILGNRWENDEPLSPDERQYLIRQVIALSLLDNTNALILAKQRYEGLMQDGLLSNAFDVITNPEGTTSEELRDVVRRTASVSTLKSFMNSYRNEFIQDGNGAS